MTSSIHGILTYLKVVNSHPFCRRARYPRESETLGPGEAAFNLVGRALSVNELNRENDLLLKRETLHGSEQPAHLP